MRLKDLKEDNELLQKDIVKILNVLETTYSVYKTENRWIPKEALIILTRF